jgi:chemotaxis protein histidine kinase CheA
MTKHGPIEIFMPPNVLKAKMGNGGLDPSAVKRAEEAIENLKGEFTAWLVEDVLHLVEARNAYVKDTNDEALGKLYRASHDLKGQATTFNFPLVSRVASSLCKLTDDTNNGIDLPKPLIDAHVDAIKVILRDRITDPSNAMASLLAAELERQTGLYLTKQLGA